MHKKAYPMKNEMILAELKEKCTLIKGRLHLECSEARSIAKKFEVNLKEIGKLCNEEKIKLFSCELGCF
jgi:hypothetical protein